MSSGVSRSLVKAQWLRFCSWMLLSLFVVGMAVAGACSPPPSGCEGDGNCQPPTPFCIEKTCVACRNNDDCSKGQTCSQGACSGGETEKTPEESKQEPADVPEEAPQQGEEPTTPDASEPTAEKDPPGPEAQPETQPEGSVKEETPEAPKVVKPPVLAKSSPACGTTKGCCLPQAGRILNAHTPRYLGRSLWSTARWSSDMKTLVFVSGDNPSVLFRKGTSANEDYTLNKVVKEHTAGLIALQYSPDGKYIAASGLDRAIIIWKVSDSSRVYRLTGHTSTVYNMSFSSDSKMLATIGSYDRYIRIWDMSTGKLIRRVRTPATVWDVAFSPDDKYLATGLDNRTIQLWNVSDGTSYKVLSGHTQRVRSVVWNADGSVIASGSDDNRVRIWDVATGKSQQTLSHSGDVYDLEFSPDGKILATACTDRTSRLWDTTTWSQIRSLPHQALVSSVDWSPDSKYLLTGNYSKEAIIWEVGTGKMIRKIFMDYGYRESMVMESNGKRLAHASTDSKDIELWDMTSRKLLYTLQGHTERVLSLSLSPNGQFLASGSADKTVKIWRLSDGKMLYDLKRHKAEVLTVEFGPKNKFLATGSHDNKVMFWNVSDGSFAKEVDTGAWVRSLAWKPNGLDIAVGTGENIQILEYATGKPKQTLTQPTGHVESLHWQKNQLAAGDWGRKLMLFNTITWQPTLDFIAHSYVVSGVRISPDESEIATVSHDNTVRIYKASDVERVQLIYGQVGPTAVAFGPKPGQYTTSGWDGTIRIWRNEDKSESIPVGEAIKSLSVSPDEQYVAVGLENGFAGVWRLSDKKKLGLFEAHEDVVRSVAFSPNGDILATSSDDTTIKLWDVRQGKQLQTLKGHVDRVYRVRFLSDGKTLLSASRDSSVRIWDVATGKQTGRYEGATGALIDVDVSPDGKYVAAASFNGRVYIWQTSDKQMYASFAGHLGGALSLMFRSNDELLSGSLDSRIRYWRLSEKRSLRNVSGHGGPVFGMAFRADKYYYATASEDKTVRVWRGYDGLLLNTAKGHTDAVNAIASTSNGQWVSGSSDGTIRIWDSVYLRSDGIQAKYAFDVTNIAISRNGSYFLSTAGDYRTRLYRLSNYGVQRTFYGSSKKVLAGDISGDNKYVAYGGEDTYMRVYAVSNGAYYSAAKHDSSVTAVMYSFDNKSILTGTDKGLVKIWDVAGKKFTKDLTTHQGRVHTLMMNADGKQILSASVKGPITLWQASDQKQLQTWSPSGADIVSAALSPKGDLVAGALAPDTIKIWKASDGKEVKTLKAPAPITGVRFGGNGVWIAASMENGRVILWDTQSYKLIREYNTQNLPLKGLVTSSTGVMAAGNAFGQVVLWRCAPQ